MTTKDQILDASNYMITDLRKEVADLKATAQRRLELLRQCEHTPVGSVCPVCWEFRIDGHKPNCPLAAELKEAK